MCMKSTVITDRHVVRFVKCPVGAHLCDKLISRTFHKSTVCVALIPHTLYNFIKQRHSVVYINFLCGQRLNDKCLSYFA